MSRFAVRVFNDPLIRTYADRYRKVMDSAKGRFLSGNINIYPNKEELFVFVEFQILIVKYWLFTLLAFFGSWLLFGFGWFSIILGLISATGYFWTSYFHKWLFRKGLRKLGYKGEVYFYG